MLNRQSFGFLRAIVPILLIVLLMAVSCSPQRYPQRSAVHPRGCNCPTFK